MLIALHNAFQRLSQPVDVMHFDSREAPPAWAGKLGVKPVYLRQPIKPCLLPPGYN